MAVNKDVESSSAFQRDLGYLDAFFDKLEAHASTLGAAEGERLRTLIGEERTRWVEIRALVAGQPVKPVQVPVPAAQTAPAVGKVETPKVEGPRAAAIPATPAAPPGGRVPRAFTVGSLRARRGQTEQK